MEKHSFKEMAELYPDRREYFLDLHERYEANQDRRAVIRKGFESLGLSPEDMTDDIRVPKKFLKLLHWYMVKDMKTDTAVGVEQTRILEILKTVFEIKE